MKRPRCTHQAPDGCPDCDGTSAENKELRDSTPEQRRAYWRGLATWRAAIVLEVGR